VLLEAGFLSNPAEERKILQPQHRELLAKAIAEAIMAYKQAVQ
jgi:N-acetylmuramoyl-L-alanine amidase